MIPDVIRPVCLPQPGQVKMEDLVPSNGQWPQVLTSRFLKTKETTVFTHSDCVQHNNNALVNEYGRTIYRYKLFKKYPYIIRYINIILVIKCAQCKIQSRDAQIRESQNVKTRTKGHL